MDGGIDVLERGQHLGRKPHIVIGEQQGLFVLTAKLVIDGTQARELELAVAGTELVGVVLGDEPLDRGGESGSLSSRLLLTWPCLILD